MARNNNKTHHTSFPLREPPSIMTEYLRPSQVIRLPLNEKEERHRSRRRIGFHVFVSRLVQDISSLPANEQNELFEDLVEEIVDDNMSVDSTDTDFVLVRGDRALTYMKKFRIACRKWRMLAERRKEAWRKRAEDLNRRPLPGRVAVVPGNYFCVLFLFVLCFIL